MKWLHRTADYLARTSGPTSSPSRSVADALRSTVEPLPPQAPDADGYYPSGYYERAAPFLRATLARASATVSAWTEEPVTATTAASGPRGSLFVSGAGILARGADPDAAADYATGRLLVAASQREYLLVREREEIQGATHCYHRAAGSGRAVEAHAPDYAAGHLAATVATVRGRERVLDKWPGWSGYFAAAEGERTTPTEAEAFIRGKAPAIVRAAYALGREAEGHTLPAGLPVDIEAMLDLGRPFLDAKWGRGEYLAQARRAIAAMTPPPGTDPESGGTDPGEGKSESEAAAEAAPGSEAEAMNPTREDRAAPAEEATSDPERHEKPGGGKPSRAASSARRFPVAIEAAPAPEATELAEMRRLARPLVAALSRIQWDSNEPPTVDHAQDSGEIDEGALAALAAWHDPRVFQRRQEQGRATVAVHILIDCSGSMGAGTRGGSYRLADARAVGYAMATAFGGSRYRVSVAGHDCRYGLDAHPAGAVVYRPCPSPESIAGLRCGGDNADGYAIERALDAVAAVPAQRRALFLLADGQPSAHGYSGEGARAHVRSMVASARARGIDFLAIGIEGSMKDTGPGLFGSRFVSLPDTRSAGPLLARIIGRIGKEAAPCA